jgi:hypothetical protein
MVDRYQRYEAGQCRQAAYETHKRMKGGYICASHYLSRPVDADDEEGEDYLHMFNMEEDGRIIDMSGGIKAVDFRGNITRFFEFSEPEEIELFWAMVSRSDTIKLDGRGRQNLIDIVGLLGDLGQERYDLYFIMKEIRDLQDKGFSDKRLIIDIIRRYRYVSDLRIGRK